MSTALPHVDQICELPLRAVVAYAFRAASRHLRGQGIEHIESLQCLLSCLEEIICHPIIPDDAAERVAMAAADAVGTKFLPTIAMPDLVLSFARAADCAIAAAMAARSKPADAGRLLRTAAEKAVAAVGHLKDDQKLRVKRDYDLLVKLFGIHRSFTLGNPFDPKDDGPLGRL